MPNNALDNLWLAFLCLMSRFIPAHLQPAPDVPAHSMRRLQCSVPEVLCMF